MRKCTHCKIEKEDSEFHNKTNGKIYICKECRKIYIRQHYQQNKQIYIENSRKRTLECREKFNEYKSTLKCKECGESHIACLDFHHKDPLSKDMNISEMFTYSKERFKEELKKCIVLCSNCHRKLHYNASVV